MRLASLADATRARFSLRSLFLATLAVALLFGSYAAGYRRGFLEPWQMRCENSIFLSTNASDMSMRFYQEDRCVVVKDCLFMPSDITDEQLLDLLERSGLTRKKELNLFGDTTFVPIFEGSPSP